MQENSSRVHFRVLDWVHTNVICDRIWSLAKVNERQSHEAAVKKKSIKTPWVQIYLKATFFNVWLTGTCTAIPQCKSRTMKLGRAPGFGLSQTHKLQLNSTEAKSDGASDKLWVHEGSEVRKESSTINNSPYAKIQPQRNLYRMLLKCILELNQQHHDTFTK